MLEAVQLSRQVTPRIGDPKALLESVSFVCPAGQVTLLAGPPGSGKHSLLEVLAGVHAQDQGTLLLHGRDLGKNGTHPNETGLVPAASDSLHEQLTVRETLAGALLLRVRVPSGAELGERVAHLLALCGLETVAKERVSSLSAIQKRRLLLAVALVSDPVLVLCDDFTRDMDAKAERELVALLKMIATAVPGRVVVNVSAALSQLPAYDSVIVLHQGQVCFHGPARAISHYFTIKSVEDLYPRLAMRPASRWGDSWSRHRDSYYDAFKIHSSQSLSGNAGEQRIQLPAGEDPSEGLGASPPEGAKDSTEGQGAASPADEPETVAPPLPRAGCASQIALLTRRRWTLFQRRRKEWRAQVLSFFGLPALTVLMVWPNKKFLDAALGGARVPPDTLWPAAYTCLTAVVVQVLMIVFMAARNGAREIAGERAAIDRERIAGVSPLAVLTAKIAFLGPLILAQSLWLGVSMEMFIGTLPGSVGTRLLLLALTGAAFTSLCLAISARARSAERAHALSLMLAYSQVLLSGALLGMPRVLGSLIHPFVTAYYGWSGIVDGMSGHAVFTPITTLLRTWFANPALAAGALLAHLAAGLVLAYIGLRQRRLP